MESRINETLLDKLFKNPTPLDRKRQIFFYLHERMFPCKKVIEEFLQTVDDGERTKRAEYIVERLCFEANFPPPYFLLSNLLDFEKSDRNKSSNQAYIPQDHFSHMVYTYLLGLYLFFYSPSINGALTKEFIRKRVEASYDPVLDATKDFLSFWKYFCLFHDIAYPIEQSYREKVDNASGTSNTIELKDEKAYDEYLEKFNHMETILSREVLLEGAAKYLVVQQMFNDYNNLPFHSVLTPLEGYFVKQGEPPVEVSIEEIKNQFGEYQLIDKIHCFEHLKMFTGFIFPEDYIIVLFDAFSEQPVAIKDKPKSDTPVYYILKNKYNTAPEAQIIKLLDHEDYLLDDRYFVRFYFKNLDSQMENAKLKNEIGRFFSSDDYQKILAKIQESSAFKNQKPESVQYFERITTSHDLNTYIFQCYRAFSKYVKEMCSPMTELPFSSAQCVIEYNKKIIREYLRTNFGNVFKSVVMDELPFLDYEEAKKDFSDLGSEEKPSWESIQKVVSGAIESLFDVGKLSDYKDSIKEKFTEELYAELDAEKNVSGLLAAFICRCNKELFPKKSITIRGFFQPDGIDVDSLVGTLKGSVKNHLSKVAEYLNEKWDSSLGKSMGFVDFVKKYKTSNYIYDHGIYGACIFLLCLQFYEKTITNLFGTKEELEFTDIMSTLCWNVEKAKYNNKLLGDYEHITLAVFKSIFCHNLYPDEICKLYGEKTLEWKYDLLKEPSTYFGMMVDALQVWNRNKYYQHSQVDWWPQFSSDYYDVVIEQNKIVLKLKTYGKDINQIIDKFLNEKDTYLKDFSTFVTVDVIHT